MRRRIVVLVFLLPACAAGYWARNADEEVGEILREKGAVVEEFRRTGLLRPEQARAEPERESPPEDLSGIPHVVGLEEALAIATARNRNYRSQRESLYLAALSLSGVRNRFSPVFSGTISSIVSDTDRSEKDYTTRAELSASQILPTGGTVSVGGEASSRAGGDAVGSGHRFDASWTASLSQPLLRDAGYEATHEELTQAERNVVYAIRDFELFREDFTIQILSQYYSLVRQLREIENAEKSLASRKFLKQQSERKFEVGLATEVDKLRSAREYLRAQSDLLFQKEAYQLALDRFKIQLGLPTSFPLEIRPEEPEYREASIDLARAVEAALHNRLDLRTQREQFEDAKRNLRIQTRRLLPDLDLTAGYTRSAPARNSLSDLAFQDVSTSIGLSLTLPLERTAERNALRRALIELDRAKRALSLAEDNVILDVRNSLRSLRRAETSLRIRKEEVRAAEKEQRAAQIRVEAGEMDNRNVTDAENAVLRARNAYVQDLMDYEIARIQLLRDVGILFIDEKGAVVQP